MDLLWKCAAMLALPLALAFASPALADAVSDQLDRGTYYAQLSVPSLDLAGRVTARREKCQWARQSRGELSQALDYYEGARRLAQNDPYWAETQRGQLGGLVTKTREALTKTDELIKQLC